MKRKTDSHRKPHDAPKRKRYDKNKQRMKIAQTPKEKRVTKKHDYLQTAKRDKMQHRKDVSAGGAVSKTDEQRSRKIIQAWMIKQKRKGRLKAAAEHITFAGKKVIGEYEKHKHLRHVRHRKLFRKGKDEK